MRDVSQFPLRPDLALKPLAFHFQIYLKFYLNPSGPVLTATVLSIRAQSIVGGTAATGSSRCSETKVGTVSVIMWALIVTLLTGVVEHQDVQHQLQLALRTQLCHNGKTSYIWIEQWNIWFFLNGLNTTFLVKILLKNK